jgi:hypothetical protein
MAKFITQLNTTYIGNKIAMVASPFIYQSDYFKSPIEVPAGFYTDFESVPRIPLIYDWLGDTSMRGGVIHDYLSRSDSLPIVDQKKAADVYYEVCRLTGNNRIEAYMKWLAVRYAWGFFHKHTVSYIPKKDSIA